MRIEIGRRFHPRRDRVFDVDGIADIDVVIDHRDEIEVLQGAERRQYRIALQPVVLPAQLLDLDHRVEAMQSARGHLDIGDDRNRRLQHLQQTGFQHVLAQNDGFASEAVDDVVDRPQPVSDGGDLQNRRVGGRRGEADEFAEWPFRRDFVDQDFAFQNELALRRHQDVLRYGLAHGQRSAGQPARDGKFVGAFRHLRTHGRCREMQRQVGPDADRHRQ